MASIPELEYTIPRLIGAGNCEEVVKPNAAYCLD